MTTMIILTIISIILVFGFGAYTYYSERGELKKEAKEAIIKFENCIEEKNSLSNRFSEKQLSFEKSICGLYKKDKTLTPQKNTYSN